MTKWRRIRTIAASVIVILYALLLMAVPKIGAPLMTLGLAIVLVVMGINALIYYFTMARYMVDGQMILCKGLLVLNAGLFILDLSDIPIQYIMIYLLAGHGFAGLAGVARSLEARRMEVSTWRAGFLMGAGNIIVSILCLVFINSPKFMVYVYGISLIGTALGNIAGAAKKTAMVYIQ